MSKKFNFEVSHLPTDVISEMSSEELQRHIFKVKRAIKEANMLGYDTIPHEVEYCYLDHERQQRQRKADRISQSSYSTHQGVQ